MSLAPNTYLLSSVAMGLAQVADAIILVRFKGRLGSLTTAFSVIEYAWAVVSFFAWQAAEDSFPRWLPVSFIAYVVAFFAAGLVIAVQKKGEDLRVPKHLSIAGGVFGLYFAVASALHVADV